MLCRSTSRCPDKAWLCPPRCTRGRGHTQKWPPPRMCCQNLSGGRSQVEGWDHHSLLDRKRDLKKGGLIVHVQNKPLDSTQDKHSHWLYLTHVSCLISYEHTPVGTRSRSGLLDTSGRNLQTKCHVLDYIRM